MPNAQDAFELTQALPWLISLALFAFSVGRDRQGNWGTEFSMTLYIKWSWVLQAFLWILESNYQVVRANPYDPTIVAWAYPCEVAFWCFSLITYVVSYVVLWGVRLPPLYWALMMVFGFVPPAILVWFMQNTWYEVLVSALIGCCLTLPLVLWMRYLLHPKDLSIMLKQRPWTWLSAIDTHLRTIEEMDRAAAAEKP
jgi:hypothetical protein